MVLVRSALMWPRVAIVIGLLAGVATAAVILGGILAFAPDPVPTPTPVPTFVPSAAPTPTPSHARAEHLPATVRAGVQPVGCRRSAAKRGSRSARRASQRSGAPRAAAT